MSHATSTLFLAAAMLVASGCGGSDGGPTRGDAGTDSGTGGTGGGTDSGAGGTGGTMSVPDSLLEWNLFADAPAQVPAAGVIPYELNSPLFTDFAAKHRFIALPDGETIDYSDDSTEWKFPVGTVLVKTFAYPVDERNELLGEQLIETRLMIRETDGWDVQTYVWNEAQTDATRVSIGKRLSVSWIDEAGETQTLPNYNVPTRSECRKCHGKAEQARTLGPSTAQLNRDNDYGAGMVNQIDHLESLRLLDQTPAAMPGRTTFAQPDDTEASMTERARAYMHANCASCHSPGGETAEKELFLDYPSTDPVGTDPFKWGVCKSPTSAGNANCDETIDVVPGDPDNSLMICRLELTTAGLMPPLGRGIPHADGIALVRGWIDEMVVDGCQ